MYTKGRIRFRYPEYHDIIHFQRWYDDVDVQTYLTHSFPMSMENETQWFNAMIHLPLREQSFLIETKVDNSWKPIGYCALKYFNDVARSAELGIVIGEKEFWNKGFGTEAMKLLIWHGFANLNLNRIGLKVQSHHQGAINCYKKAGMTLEGQLRDYFYKYGEYVDSLLFSILRKEWNEKERDEKNGQNNE